MVSLACGVSGIGCGETATPSEYALRVDMTYQTELGQQGVELRWGSAQARGGPGINTSATSICNADSRRATRRWRWRIPRACWLAAR